jgi:pimeloyl-ACP methyl ester carboxylesterase
MGEIMESLVTAKIQNPLVGEPCPTVVNTSRGPVEYATYGEGPAVLALHGAMGGYDQGLILARTIGRVGYRYISVSRPGYLGTPLTAGRTPEQQADLCAELLDLLRIRETAVMAVSGGGPCAIHLALRHRERCRGLVLVSTCADIIDTPIPLSFRTMKLLARWPAFVNFMRRKTMKDPERAARRSIADPVVLARTMRDPDAGPLFTALMDSTFDTVPLRLPGTENDIAVTRGTSYPLEEITVPVLIVHGTADRMVPFAKHAKVLEARVPGAELLAIEGGEHACIFTHLHEVRASVTNFFQRIEAIKCSESGVVRP